jgi:hypothetical protein
LQCLGLQCLGLQCLGLQCLGLQCLGLQCLGLQCLGLTSFGLQCTRQFGKQAIGDLNLTRMEGHDNFLMSFSDFVGVVAQRGVLRQLLTTRGLWWFILRHSHLTKPWFKSLESVGISILVMLEEDIERSKFHLNLTNTTDISMDEAQLVGMHLLDPSSISRFVVDESIVKLLQPSLNHSAKPRRLLADENDTAIFRYSTLSAGTDGYSNIPLASSMADNWLEGPFGWPPRYARPLCYVRLG